jgi:hypothetical protein
MRVFAVWGDNCVDLIVTTHDMNLIAYAQLGREGDLLVVLEMVSRPGFGALLSRTMGMLAFQHKMSVFACDLNDASHSVFESVTREGDCLTVEYDTEKPSFVYRMPPSAYFMESLRAGEVLLLSSDDFIKQGQDWFYDSYSTGKTAWIDEVTPIH